MNIVPTNASPNVAPPLLTHTSTGPSFVAYLGASKGMTSGADPSKSNSADTLENRPSAQGLSAGSASGDTIGSGPIWSNAHLLNNRAAGFSETGLEGLGDPAAASDPEAGSDGATIGKTIVGTFVNETNELGRPGSEESIAAEQSALPSDNMMSQTLEGAFETAPEDVSQPPAGAPQPLLGTLTAISLQNSDQKSPTDGVEQDKNTVDFNDIAAGSQSINVSEENGQINLAVMNLAAPIEQDQFLRNAQMIVYHLGMTLGKISYNGKTI